MPLRLGEEIAIYIRAQCSEAYPHECCGALLGRDGEDRFVADLLPLANRRDDSPQNRFSITGHDVRAAERAARERRFELIGWYHSHPDHPSRPSAYDLEHAWPWYSYVIVSVVRREPKEMTSWRLADDRSSFHPEDLHLEVRPGAKWFAV